jgi:5-methylcytosine-specific restriction enzyme A
VSRGRLPALGPRVQEARLERVPTLTGWDTGGPSPYDYAWQKRRAAHLRAHPLCEYCKRQGLVTPATVADHITPHRGDPALFAGPLQSLCATCHGSIKAREENEAGQRT